MIDSLFVVFILFMLFESLNTAFAHVIVVSGSTMPALFGTARGDDFVVPT